MTSVNQSHRYANRGDDNNPLGIIEQFKPMRWVFNNVNPLPDSGENQWFYLNIETGELFQKTNGVWYSVYNFDTGTIDGITDIENNGSGVPWFKNIVGNTAHFRSLVTMGNQIDAATGTDEITLTMSPFYKPVLLAGIRDNAQLDISVGSSGGNPNGVIGGLPEWPNGSLWIQQPGTLWILQNTTTKNWALYTPAAPVIPKRDYVNWAYTAAYTQSINGSWQDITFINPFPYAQLVPGSKFTTFNDGSRQVWVRQPVTEEKGYQVSLDMIITDFAGATSQEAIYTIRLVRKTGPIIYNQSYNGFVSPVSPVANRKVIFTSYFVIWEPLTAQQEYYFQIEGKLTGGGAAPNFNIEKYGVSFTEI